MTSTPLDTEAAPDVRDLDASAVRRAETTASSTAAASRSRTSGAAWVSSGLLVMQRI